MQRLRLNHFFPPIFGRLIRWTKSAFRTTYKVGDIALAIPRFLDLPNIQAQHPLYDRFLPVLCRFLDGDKVIVDVGANIGDTTVAIAQHCTNPILCIEPSTVFYPFLLENLKRISNPQRVKTLQAMVGSGGFTGTLDHSVKGTARLSTQTATQSINFVSLDSLEDRLEGIILLKSDTDGYDFDVILSASKVLERDEPVLFWENEIYGETQLEGFEKLYTQLEKVGYSHLYVFDNFGNLMLKKTSYESLRSLNAYLHSIRHHGQTRTFYYVDILACTEKHQAAVASAITEFRNLINQGQLR